MKVWIIGGMKMAGEKKSEKFFLCHFFHYNSHME